MKNILLCNHPRLLNGYRVTFFWIIDLHAGHTFRLVLIWWEQNNCLHVTSLHAISLLWSGYNSHSEHTWLWSIWSSSACCSLCSNLFLSHTSAFFHFGCCFSSPVASIPSCRALCNLLASQMCRLALIDLSAFANITKCLSRTMKGPSVSEMKDIVNRSTLKIN